MKTTNKHFELFKSECEYWVKIFGLINYEIYYSHTDDVLGGCIADCTRDSVARIAKLSLCKTLPKRAIIKISDDSVKLAAFEEVCHVLLASLSNIAECRYINQGEIDEAEHGIIRVLQNILIPNKAEDSASKHPEPLTPSRQPNQRQTRA